MSVTPVVSSSSVVRVVSYGSIPSTALSPDDTGTEQHNFAYGDATPATVLTCPAGKTVLSVSLVILTPFNGSGAALTVGDAADIDRLMSANENDPAIAGTFESHPAHTYVAATIIKLWITPGGGASAGNGILLIRYSD